MGHCSICIREKSMVVSDNTKAAECLGDFFKYFRYKRFNVLKKMAKEFLKNPGRALENGENVGNPLAFRGPKAALSTLPNVICFCHTGEGLYLGIIV